MLHSPPKEQVLGILNEVWKYVTKLEDAKEYVTVADVYIEYPLKYATAKETNILLGDILRHVKEGLAYEKLQGQLQSIVTKVVSHYSDFNAIFGMVRKQNFFFSLCRTISCLYWICLLEILKSK